MPYTPLTAQNLKKLADLKLKTLAIMHGSSFTGDCARAREDLNCDVTRGLRPAEVERKSPKRAHFQRIERDSSRVVGKQQVIRVTRPSGVGSPLFSGRLQLPVSLGLSLLLIPRASSNVSTTFLVARSRNKMQTDAPVAGCTRETSSSCRFEKQRITFFNVSHPGC